LKGSKVGVLPCMCTTSAVAILYELAHLHTPTRTSAHAPHKHIHLHNQLPIWGHSRGPRTCTWGSGKRTEAWYVSILAGWCPHYTVPRACIVLRTRSHASPGMCSAVLSMYLSGLQACRVHACRRLPWENMHTGHDCACIQAMAMHGKCAHSGLCLPCTS